MNVFSLLFKIIMSEYSIISLVLKLLNPIQLCLNVRLTADITYLI